MNLVADESVDFGIVEELRRKGLVVLSIIEEFSGMDDSKVLRIASEKECLLLTEDKDFGELIYRLKLYHKGILLIRLSDLSRKKRIEFVAETVEEYSEKLKDNFSVLTSNGLRIKTGNK